MSRFATALPVGMQEFDSWSKEVIELSGKYADEDSMRYAMANIIQHLPSHIGFVPKNYFVNSMRKAASNQIAAQIFMDIKNKQQAAVNAAKAEEERLTQLAEVTAMPTEVTTSDVKERIQQT